MCPRAKVLQAHPAHPVAVVQLAASACPGWDDVLWHVLGMVGMLGMGKRYVGVLSGPGILGGHYKTTVACPCSLGEWWFWVQLSTGTTQLRPVSTVLPVRPQDFCIQAKMGLMS